MADVNHEKTHFDKSPATGSQLDGQGDGVDVPARPQGWMYKSPKIGPVQVPWYASPVSQLVIVAFVCFLCPGMFNALSGMGGGGQVDAYAADNANVALYSTFAVVGK